MYLQYSSTPKSFHNYLDPVLKYFKQQKQNNKQPIQPKITRILKYFSLNEQCLFFSLKPWDEGDDTLET
jgi:hypothetical protein